MKQIDTISELFNTCQKVFITTHIRPDADAIGSSLALYHYFKIKGIEAVLVVPNEPAEYYNWFPGIDNVIVFDNEKEKSIQNLISSDLIIVVDFSQLSRNGDLGKIISEQKIKKIVIDHHPEPELFFDAYYWDTAFCAAAEAVFEVLKYVDRDSVKDLNISTCLYAALIADSGSFSYSSVTAQTHYIAAELIESGINHSWIDKQIFKKFTEKRILFWGYCLHNKLKFYHDGTLAVITISKKEFETWDVAYSDTENLVNMPMMAENVLVSVIAAERNGKIKLSFRSKGDIPVNKIARENFAGGGHKNAAGGDSEKDLNETVKIIIEKVKSLF